MGNQEVKVDAGNGKVLAQEAADSGQESGPDTPEAGDTPDAPGAGG